MDETETHVDGIADGAQGVGSVAADVLATNAVDEEVHEDAHEEDSADAGVGAGLDEGAATADVVPGAGAVEPPD